MTDMTAAGAGLAASAHHALEAGIAKAEEYRAQVPRPVMKELMPRRDVPATRCACAARARDRLPDARRCAMKGGVTGGGGMDGIAAAGIRAGFDARTGLLESFTVEDQGRELAPLHRAPWVGTDEVMPPEAAPHLATLGGDFFCAPFAGNEGDSPLHGWPPNAPWTVVARDGGTLRAVLGRPVMGATLVKELVVADGHPFVYQRHVFIGGEGRVAVANHANVAVRGGAHIRNSAKRHWETPGTPLETDPARGRSALRYPAQATDPRAFPGLAGPVDLTTYPWAPRHEDFVAGLEAAGATFGWTAVARKGAGDLYLSLRDPRRLPMTMLWHSDGGRDYAPWSGRHFGCLGVEEGAAQALFGISTDADLAGPGALALRPDGIAEVRHVIGAIAWPTEEPVAEVTLEGDAIRVRGEAGAERELPIRGAFLAEPTP
jgi:hypothetical protein